MTQNQKTRLVYDRWEFSRCTCRSSHGSDQNRRDTQNQAEGRGGEARHLSLGVRGGGQDSLVESLVGQTSQSLTKIRHTKHQVLFCSPPRTDGTV